MRRRTSTYEMDMCSGAVLPKVLRFSMPLMLTGILQLLYNAADIIVVGQYSADSTALAAVTSTGALINLIVNLFMGLSVGASVAVARRYGSGDLPGVNRALHTSIALSLVGGVVVAIVGFFFSRTLLEWMQSPADVIDQSTLYLKIYFLGIPAMMVFNFSAAALRAIGDSKRPLYYLTISGLVNVGLNLLLVAVFHMGVAGVAIATAASQFVSMALVVICMVRSDGCIHLDFQKIRIDPEALKDILKIGIPAGLQSTVFSLSNVLIQSSVNSFGSADIVAANGVAGNVEGFVYTSMNAISQATLTFTGQNMGAKRYDRLMRILRACSALVTIVGIAVGGLVYLFGPQLLKLYTKDPDVIAVSMVRMGYIALPYFLCGLMEVLAGMLRGCGNSVTPMIISMLGACGLRIVWIMTIFQTYRTLPSLYLSYPVSWIVTALAQLICFILVWRRLPKNQSAANEA